MDYTTFQEFLNELEDVAEKYNQHITHFIAGDKIELTIEEKKNESDKGGAE